jgi:hypothetical protein
LHVEKCNISTKIADLLNNSEFNAITSISDLNSQSSNIDIYIFILSDYFLQYIMCSFVVCYIRTPRLYENILCKVYMPMMMMMMMMKSSSLSRLYRQVG